MTARFHAVAARQTADWRRRLEATERLRATLGYEATLARGYAVVWSGAHVVTRKADAARAGALELQFADGCLRVGAGGGGARRGGAATTPRPSRAACCDPAPKAEMSRTGAQARLSRAGAMG